MSSILNFISIHGVSSGGGGSGGGDGSSGGSDGMQELIFTASDAIFPSNGPAGFGTFGSHKTITFDADSQENAIFESLIPSTYTSGNLQLDILWVAESGSGDVLWQAQLEGVTPDSDSINSDSYGVIVELLETAASSNQISKGQMTIPSGQVGAGELFRLKVTRAAGSGSDSLDADSEILRLALREV